MNWWKSVTSRVEVGSVDVVLRLATRSMPSIPTLSNVYRSAHRNFGWRARPGHYEMSNPLPYHRVCRGLWLICAGWI